MMAASSVDVEPLGMLDIDPALDEQKALRETLKAVGLSPSAGRVIFSHLLLYIMREIFTKAYKAPCCSVFLYGRSGSFKTSYAALLTQLHERSQGILSPQRLNASTAMAEVLLYEKSNCTIVLDDLFPTSDQTIRRHQEKTLLEITRIVADGISRGRVGSPLSGKPPTCGVVFTGEYIIGVGSTAARLLPVQITPIDSAILHECQERPLVLPTFVNFFVKWCGDHCEEIKCQIQAWRAQHATIKLGVHPRLSETHFFLCSAYRVFLWYCVMGGFAPRGCLQTDDVTKGEIVFRPARQILSA